MTAPPVLRDYQVDVIGRFETEVSAGRRRILLVMATGGGKTLVAASIISNATSEGQRVLFLAHRRELVQQTSRKLYDVGVDHGIVAAGFAMRPGVPVQIASIATVQARAIRASSMELPPADLVVIDEAHHCRARSYQSIMQAYPSAIILGLTATPCRGDGRGLGSAFEAMVECPDVAALIAAGYLVPARVYAPSQPDLTGVRIERGDYVERQLAERMDRPKLVGDIVGHWHKLAERRPTVVFATGVAHSLHLRDEFRLSGVWAEHIDGGTPAEARDHILTQLAAGQVEVVCNAMVLTEGWDSPTVSCLILARPTHSLGLYRQMVGRVLRPAPGKVYALILDHAGAVFAHGLPDDEVEWTLAADRKARNATPSGGGGRPAAPALTSCPECTAIRFEGRDCTVCGWRPFRRAEAVEVADGELGRVDRSRKAQVVAPSAAEKESFHRQLLWIGREKGYSDGWAAHKFKEKFGHWPPRNLPMPVPASPEVRSWVRSRQIAYAKAMEKRRLA